jgi:hypothetical protein
LTQPNPLAGSMCPPSQATGPPEVIDAAVVEQQEPDDAPAVPAVDPLAAFAIDAARRQAAERLAAGTAEEGDDGEVDEGFIQRALAESKRMRGEAQKDYKKRADLAARIAATHGEQGADLLAAAMAEHAAEVLSPQLAVAAGMDNGRNSPLEGNVAA